MPQSDPLQFKSAKLFKGYKPIVAVKLTSKQGNDIYRFASKSVTPSGDSAFTNIIKSLPSISRSLKRFGGMSSVGSISFSILNQGKYSDFLRTSTDKLGLIMGTALVSMLFDDGTAVTWVERLDLFSGIMDDFDFDYDKINFSIIDNNKNTNKIIGTLISSTDAAQNDDLPKDSIGKTKPIIYGNHRFYMDSTLCAERNFEGMQNLSECIYLGIDSSDKHRWLISPHKIENVDTFWMWFDEIEKFVKLRSWTVEQNNSNGCIISINDLEYVYDYLYSNGNIGGEVTIGGGTITTAKKAANKNIDDYGELSAPDTEDPFPAGASASFWVDFPIYNKSIENADIDEILIYIESVFDEGGFEGNSEATVKVHNHAAVNMKGATSKTDYHSYACDSNCVDIDAPAVFLIKGATEAPDAESNILKIYTCYKRIKIKPKKFLPLYFGGRGYEYGIWINGRSTNETDSNTGENYTVNHPDDDGSGNLIENPVGMIESVARDLINLGDSDIEMNSFNVAADARSSYKFSFAITEQTDAIELLSKLAFECGCWLFWNYANRLEILAYDSSPDFSVSGGAIPISDDIFIHQPEIHAIDFDNTNNAKITFTGHADHRITGDLTVEAWVYFTNFDDDQMIISCGKAGELQADNYLYFIYFSAANKVVCLHEYDAGIDEIATITLTTSLNNVTWYYINIRRTGSYYYARIYDIEGTLIASGSAVYNNEPNGGENAFLTIGNNAATTIPMNGKIKEMRLWNDVRTINEITGNLWKILIGNEANLVGYWRLDEGALTNVDDITANDHDGTVNLTGCTWSTGKTYPDLGYYAQHPIIKDSFSIRLTGTKDLINDLTLNYYKNYQSGNYQKISNEDVDASIAKYGTLTETLNIDFIKDTITANSLRNDLLIRKKEKYYIATFKTWLNAANKLEGDICNLRHPLLDNGAMTTAQMEALKWQIIAIKHLLNSCEIEIKAISLSIP